ncbi:M20/M25/M40 family metallo-hydrolase [Bartonella sp. DGB1]|uniref:M20/M25/M40 family metallo-hydrolase n=1 Tax=Bartonella sp. DGB1 TaxID=3239807 RepID=UPI003525A877
MLEKILSKIDSSLDANIEHLFDFLRIASISTDSNYSSECEKAANWLVEDLSTIGFKAQACKTKLHPIVLAHYMGETDSDFHVLFYGHYDVQPVDPLELWHHDPFDPQIKLINGHKAIVARGASDDKGQVMTFIEACRAYHNEYGRLPVKVTIMIEGEEEMGSPSLDAFFEQYKDQLKADVVLVCDTSMRDRETPSITTSLRGGVAEEIIIHAANRDLHSGEYGGIAANPINILTKICGELKDENGRILLDGFYDAVPDMPQEIVDSWLKLEKESPNPLTQIGLSEVAGEKGYSLTELLWSRPSLDITGITGGYTGEGFKTVIASEAKVKISCRLVGKQDPDKIRASLRKFFEERLPKDCSISYINHGGSPAVFLPTDSPILKKVQNALGDEWNGRQALLSGCGASIPIVGDFQKYLGLDSLLVGYALSDDAIHSPNEKYDLASFHKGQRAWARILSVLSV